VSEVRNGLTAGLSTAHVRWQQAAACLLGITQHTDLLDRSVVLSATLASHVQAKPPTWLLCMKP